jgi:ArpU family phage transcriptional regulator
MPFLLPEIDRKKTKSAVEEKLEKYRLYLLSVPDERAPKVTSTYSLVPPTNTNLFHSSTEDAAINNVDLERKKESYIEWVRRGINRLKYKEREIIIRRYFSDDEMYDYELYNEMGMSERKFYRLKARAFYSLAFALKIEVYEELDVNEA